MSEPITTDLLSVARFIRSKNAGPFRCTFDVIFHDRETFESVRELNPFDKQHFADLLHVAVEDVTDLVWFAPGNALKITITRLASAGSPADTDVYGAQQHIPLLGMKIRLAPGLDGKRN